MTCREAVITNFISLRENQTVNEALAILNQYNIRSAPVIDSAGKYLGMFNLRITLTSLLPTPVTMEGGLPSLDFMHGATPSLAKKLKKIGGDHIRNYLDTKKQPEYPDTPLIEAIRLMIKQGSPTPVIDKETSQVIGILSEQSVISALHKLQYALASKPDEISEDDIQLLKKFGVLK